MKVNWINEKETLERLIDEGVSYERIGKRYGVSGNAVKKAAKKLDIELEQKRVINPNEHFNKGKKTVVHYCLNCGAELINTQSKYCSNKCQGEYRKNKLIEAWKNGEYKGNSEYLSDTIKEYLLKKSKSRCEMCGFEGYNILTNNTILQIHHKDGDSSNNKEENLQVLCPNCHAMTETYGNTGKRKSSRTRYDSKTYYFEKFKKEFGIV